MANKHYDSIFKHFKETFESHFAYAEELFGVDDGSNKKIHNAEFGAYREKLVRNFLRSIIPYKFDISEGFLINRKEKTSKQIDIVVYDKINAPLIEDQLNNRFFPVESVVGIGEVKSIIHSKSDLKKHLKKLASNKSINRERNSEYIVCRDDEDISSNGMLIKDQPFSFLICKKLDFDISNLENDMDEIYKDIDIRFWHNFIFSIEDGYFGYQDPEKSNPIFTWASVNSTGRNKCLSRTSGNSGYAHFRTFAKAVNILSFSTTIYRPHLPDYITFDPSAEFKLEKDQK